MAKNSYSYTASSKKSRDKYRKIRADAKANGEYISLSEAKKRSGYSEEQETNKTEAYNKANPSVEPQKEISLGAPIVLDKAGVTTGAGQKSSELEPTKPQGILSRGMDILSAPLSQPITTLTGGLGAGADAVKESREKIEGGDYGEAAKSIGTTVATTAAIAAVVLSGSAIVGKLTTYAPQAGQAVTGASKGTQIIGKLSSVTKSSNFWRVANNAKNFALKKTILQKLAATAKNPTVILGILGSVLYTSLFWAPNEKGDALTTLTITQKEALKNGDAEAVKEIDDLIQETLNISASIPVIGFIKAELAKFKAAAKASQIYADEANKLIEEKARIEEQGESDFEKQRRESDEASFARKDEYNKEESERYEDIQSKNDERDAEKADKEKADREAETARYEQIKADNDAEKLKDAQIMQEVWRLRREGKQEEADALELTAYQ